MVKNVLLEKKYIILDGFIKEKRIKQFPRLTQIFVQRINLKPTYYSKMNIFS